MWHWIDLLIVMIVVSISAVYALFKLSPITLQRRLLSYLIRIIGLRVYAWLSPSVGGCDGCGSSAAKWNRKGR